MAKKTVQNVRLITELRQTCIRLLLASGLYVNEIIDQCQLSQHFELNQNRRKGSTHYRVRRILKRGTIRGMIYAVQRELKLPDGKEEIKAANERLSLAFRMAVEQGDVRAMVRAEQIRAKMLGLRLEPIGTVGADAASIQDQLRAMQSSVGEG